MVNARVALFVLDSLGVGELPDAGRYGDTGSNTLGNIARAMGGLKLPNLGRLGLGNIIEVEGVPPAERPLASFGKMAEQSAGKDTTTGHWEIAGIILEKPFPVYPYGFPEDLIREFENRIGRKVLGNKAASGTEIIEELGADHMATGSPIVYTSADSVFQIAAHEEAFGLQRLYALCTVARRLCDRWNVGRVIARPFIGSPAQGFHRTAHRHDYALPPPAPTLLDAVQTHGGEVIAVGKMGDIFAQRGVTRSLPAAGHAALFDTTLAALDAAGDGALVATNFVDFDSTYGHRRDALGYAAALEAFDVRLPELWRALRPGDLAVLSADHGCDPTWRGSDHTREAVPVLAWGPGLAPRALGRRKSFADIGQSLATHLRLPPLAAGRSFLDESCA
mgnify:CR=1 FL=1